MTDLQKKELELLKIFLGICEKYNLTYYLVCGSALGAVKYKGFIPWDDDIDIALPRKDYEMFLQKAPTELPEWVFLQNYRTDPAYPGLGSKLRNTNTTFIEKEASRLPMNHGVFIDIFPLDGYPQNPELQNKFEKAKWKHYRKRYTGLIPFWHRDIGLTLNSFLRFVFGCFKNTAVACQKIESLMKANSLENSDLWCNFANSMSKSEYVPREQYGKGREATFEGLTVRIPELYDPYLRQKYGDYTQDLPESQKHAPHAYLVDLEKSYRDYYVSAKVSPKTGCYSRDAIK